MTKQERYDYHNNLFNKWYSVIYLPARDAHSKGDLPSHQFATYQRKKAMLLKNIDMAEANLTGKGLI